MNENKNCLICTIDDSNKCVRINQVADCGNKYRESITAMTVVFISENIRRASEPLKLVEPLSLDVGDDRLKQEVSKLVIARYGNEYQWMKEDCFAVMPDKEVWQIRRCLSCVILMFSASFTAFAFDEFVWNYKKIDNGVEASPAMDKSVAGRVVVPKALSNEPVISVVGFSGYTNIAEIVFPDSIKTFSANAFSGCRNLDRLTFEGDAPTIIDTFAYGYLAKPTIYFVQGRDGWPLDQEYITGNGTWCGRYANIGGVKVNQYVNGIMVSDRHVIAKGSSSIITLKHSNYSTSFGHLSASYVESDIYYTLDGSEPTTNSTKYANPIVVTRPITVKAMTTHMQRNDWTVTETCSYAFGQVVRPDVIMEEAAFYYSGILVTLSCETLDAEIRYTLDGSEPSEESRLYTGPFAIDDTTTVKAKAFKEDWFESETATATFTREWYTVDVPVIEPSGAAFENVSQTVALSCATDGATMLYTTDGSDPKVNGREYTKPFAIYKSCTVRAIAVKYDWKDSAEATAIFTRGESLSEAANLYGYTMETDSAAPWTVDAAVSHDGVSSVRSGAIGNNGMTYLMASVKKAGTVSFWWKAQCEEPDEEDGEDGYYDYGAFLVDDVAKARIAGNDTGWRFVSVEVPTGGKHVLRWEYRKDNATSYAPDCVWLDQVQWIPADGSGYTLTSPEPVPYSWLSQYGLGVASGDFEAAANAASGKQNCGRPTEVWEEYVAGLDPTNANSQLKAMIEMLDGAPIVTWEPNLNTNGVVRTYKVYGSETLENGGSWHYPTNSLHRFFRVAVEMP